MCPPLGLQSLLFPCRSNFLLTSFAPRLTFFSSFLMLINNDFSPCFLLPKPLPHTMTNTGKFSTLRACSSSFSRLKVKPRAHQSLSITPILNSSPGPESKLVFTLHDIIHCSIVCNWFISLENKWRQFRATWEEGLKEEQANHTLKPGLGSNTGYKSCLTVQTLLLSPILGTQTGTSSLQRTCFG